MSTGPDTWGPHGWKFIHFIALGYPNNPTPEDKEKYKQFFKLFGDMIPCSLCGSHYKKNFNNININNYLNSKNDLIQWTILMHNEVNKSNGKKTYSFQEGINMIIDGQQPIKCNEKFENSILDKSDTNNLSNSNLINLFLIIIIIVLILYIYKRNSC